MFISFEYYLTDICVFPNKLYSISVGHKGFKSFRISLQNSDAQYVDNKMSRQFRNFSVCISNTSAKKLPKTLQKPLQIASAIAPSYLSISSRAMIWFFICEKYQLKVLLMEFLFFPMKTLPSKLSFVVLCKINSPRIC